MRPRSDRAAEDSKERCPAHNKQRSRLAHAFGEAPKAAPSGSGRAGTLYRSESGEGIGYFVLNTETDRPREFPRTPTKGLGSEGGDEIGYFAIGRRQAVEPEGFGPKANGLVAGSSPAVQSVLTDTLELPKTQAGQCLIQRRRITVAKTNVRQEKDRPKTHEGGPARVIDAAKQLERTLNACLLFEGTFYESGVSVAERLYDAVAAVQPELVAEMAVRARNKLFLRHAPLLVAVAMTDSPSHLPYVEDVLAGTGEAPVPGQRFHEGWKPGIIRRPDELGEFLSLYWTIGKGLDGKASGGRRPIAARVKRGLARALNQFDSYQLGKWKGSKNSAITLRDVLRLIHPTPVTKEQAQWFNGLIDGTLEAPDTWEVALSGGEDKSKAFTRLMEEQKLPAMAFLMNLRNMIGAGVGTGLMSKYADTLRFARVLPHRFIAAERYAPQMSDALERGMLRALENSPKFPGMTFVLVDNSGSMHGRLSDKSEMSYADAACALAIHAREVSEECRVFVFSNDCKEVPNRRGFALRDAIRASMRPMGTNGGAAVEYVSQFPHDRLIMISDEQLHDRLPNPKQGTKGYVINVAAYNNGVGYEPWTNISGFSPDTIRYAMTVEGVLPGVMPEAEEG